MGVANQVYSPKIDPKGSISAFFTVFGRETAVFSLEDRFFLIHKKLLLIKIHLQNLKHVGANQVYPPKIAIDSISVHNEFGLIYLLTANLFFLL